MARLSDYGINIDDASNSRKVIIQGHEFPVVFTMETMEYIADVYGGDYSQFESDMNSMLRKKENQINSGNLSASDLKIMRALIYGMLRTGGLEESPGTIFKFLGMNSEVLSAYAACMEIFADQTFQVEDLKKIEEATRLSKSASKKKEKQEESEEVGTPWSFYFYVALTLLNWSEGFFLKSTPNLWLKSYLHWLKNNTDFDPPESITMDKSPWW